MKWDTEDSNRKIGKDSAHLSSAGGPFQARWGRNAEAAVEAGKMTAVTRTLMKSQPELAELLATVTGVEVTMAEKGFGTRVEVRAEEASGLVATDLERILDYLAEPQKQPFGIA